jgi:DNA ligase-associated metallophosphoesterase
MSDHDFPSKNQSLTPTFGKGPEFSKEIRWPCRLANGFQMGQTGNMSHDFALNGQRLSARPSGALFWPSARRLVVSDLHFGKSERLARRGGALLPPYDTRTTLARLDAEIEATGAREVICLGDSFDDLDAAGALDEADRLWLTRMMAGRDWIWILGNHDPGPLDLGGTLRAELLLEGIALRHIAGADTPEISGHYHPKASLPGRSAPCFLIDASRVILPAFGAYTGGLAAHDPAFAPLFGPGALAVLTGRECLTIPMPRR